ncbi:hypothetical protein [Flavobacterium dankookense]|uniref:Outer membrane beta-barrel porin/alpha-amylase n=1 Tax=Flavobacterium dankookense TaxID=706186 RepID=A0A4R6Q5V3_9FLAO|nr:hypothetical protein [Flavobacterium dankookense]TDP57788.1 hypothetical protein BC748_2605 [Flavobacterium dankookense]
MKNFCIVLLLVITSNLSFAQGCSDAGICSIGKAFQEETKTFKNSFEINATLGQGDGDVSIFTQSVTYARKFTDKFSLSTRVTYNTADGDLGSNSQLGDVYLIGNYKFKENNNKQWSVLAGWKIPLTNADAKDAFVSLPMDYQASLGTFDLFLGTNLNYKAWDFNLAFQIPVINNNKNAYYDEFSASNDFPSTNYFERKSDALFRTIYTLKTANNKFLFKPNVLFIYHLGEDTFENLLGNRESIQGSDGLTINGNLIGIYNINSKNSIELSVATPFVVRDVRPDGLTRSFVLGLNYRILF